ncbi:MAG: hypothetical protein ACPG4T_13435 [Nannocystaceae bacterium]
MWAAAIAAVVGLGLWTHNRLQPIGEAASEVPPPAPAKQAKRPAQVTQPTPAAPKRKTPPPKVRPRLAKPAPAIPVDAPEVSPELQTAVTQLSTLYTHFDAQVYGQLFTNPPLPVVLQEMLDWYESMLGSCGPPVPFVAKDATQARFLFPCEQGQWEAEILLDEDGKVKRLRQGARGVDPGVAVLQAAEQVIALLAKWDDEVFSATFGERFSGEEMRPFFAEFTAKWGPCELDDIDLANTRGALIDLVCTNGPRMMKIDLHREDDRIRIFRLGQPRSVKWR